MVKLIIKKIYIPVMIRIERFRTRHPIPVSKSYNSPIETDDAMHDPFLSDAPKTTR